jgi:hypothetical protein
MFGLSMIMMPVAKSAMNQLPKRYIPHGAAIGNTLKMIASSVGTAILFTVMTTTAETAKHLSRYVWGQCSLYGGFHPFITSSHPFFIYKK